MRILVSHHQLLKQWKFNTLASIKYQVNQLLKVQELNLWTKEAIPKIVLEKTGKLATQEFIDGATKTFALWCISTYETIMKRGN